MTTLTREPADDKTATMAMQMGLTPAVVEHAYRNRLTRQLAREHLVQPETVTALALRWGIVDG